MKGNCPLTSRFISIQWLLYSSKWDATQPEDLNGDRETHRKYGSEAGNPITAEEQTDQSDQLTKSSVTPNDHQVFFSL